MDLTKKKCEECESGTKPFEKAEAEKHLSMLKTEWELLAPAQGKPPDEYKIRKKYKFEDFIQAMKFVNKVADLAEDEGHHPDIFISYSRVTITLWTHSVGGLSINDFILASKIELIN